MTWVRDQSPLVSVKGTTTQRQRRGRRGWPTPSPVFPTTPFPLHPHTPALSASAHLPGHPPTRQTTFQLECMPLPTTQPLDALNIAVASYTTPNATKHGLQLPNTHVKSVMNKRCLRSRFSKKGLGNVNIFPHPKTRLDLFGRACAFGRFEFQGTV